MKISKRTEIYFGDDILGANIDTNDKVVATWLNTKADRANDKLSSFQIDFSLLSNKN